MNEDIQRLKLVRDKLGTGSLNPVYDDLAWETGVYVASKPEPEPVLQIPDPTRTSMESIQKFVRYALDDLTDIDSEYLQ